MQILSGSAIATLQTTLRHAEQSHAAADAERRAWRRRTDQRQRATRRRTQGD
jgi:hypothetical protein